MKKYIVKDCGIEWNYDENKERAINKAIELDTEVLEKTVWRYYAPYYTSGSANYREISGLSLVETIKESFNLIIKDCGLGGVSGLKLKSVKLSKKNGDTNLIIRYIPLGKLGIELQEEEKKIKIEWVTDDEFNGEYIFKIHTYVKEEIE